MEDEGDGNYRLCFTPTIAKKYTLAVEMKHPKKDGFFTIQGSPVEFNVTPGMP